MKIVDNLTDSNLLSNLENRFHVELIDTNDIWSIQVPIKLTTTMNAHVDKNVTKKSGDQYSELTAINKNTRARSDFISPSPLSRRVAKSKQNLQSLLSFNKCDWLTPKQVYKETSRKPATSPISISLLWWVFWTRNFFSKYNCRS